MTGVDLTGIHFSRTRVDNDWLKIIDDLRHWPVCYTDKHLTIGCQRHTIAEWQAFNDDEIDGMDELALAWWAKHKDTIMSTITSNPATSTLTGV